MEPVGHRHWAVNREVPVLGQLVAFASSGALAVG